MEQAVLVGMTVEPRRIMEAIDSVQPNGPDDTRLALITARDLILRERDDGAEGLYPTEPYQFYVHDPDELSPIRSAVGKNPFLVG